MSKKPPSGRAVQPRANAVTSGCGPNGMPPERTSSRGGVLVQRGALRAPKGLMRRCSRPLGIGFDSLARGVPSSSAIAASRKRARLSGTVSRLTRVNVAMVRARR